MERVILVLLASLGLSFFVAAQESTCKLKKNPDLKKELRSYYEQNTYPVLKDAHRNFEKSISVTDFKALQKLRADNKQLEADRKALQKEVKGLVKAGKTKEEAKVAFETQFQAMRTAKMEIRKKLRPIAENNRDQLQATLEDLQPKREQWKTDRKAIVAKYYSPEELAACRNKWQEKKARHKEAKPQSHRPGTSKRLEGKRAESDSAANKERRKKTRAVHKFLLWDGEMKDFSFEENQNRVGGMDAQAEFGLGQNFPNPASSSTTVKVNLPQDSDYLTVTITDASGRQLRQFNYDAHRQGEHSLILEVDDLGTGNYFYTVQAKGFKETKQMSIK